jgi:putative flippase GtrA
MNDATTPPRSLPQMGRYLAVGGFNTVFGYTLFAVLNFSLQGLGRYSYLLASFLSNMIAITAAFLGYKVFVFRTKGNYLREWSRCVLVYGSGMLVTLAGLTVLVPILRTVMAQHSQLAPYVAAGIMAVVVVILSFFGHKHISFASSPPQPNRKGSRTDYLPD